MMGSTQSHLLCDHSQLHKQIDKIQNVSNLQRQQIYQDHQETLMRQSVHSSHCISKQQPNLSNSENKHRIKQQSSHTPNDDHQCNIALQQLDELQTNQKNVCQSLRPYNAAIKRYKLLEDLLPPSVRMFRQYNRSKQIHQRKYCKIERDKQQSAGYCLGPVISSKQLFEGEKNRSQQGNCGISGQLVESNKIRQERDENCQQAKKEQKGRETVDSNNQYLRSMHQEIVNRLLDIIKDSCNPGKINSGQDRSKKDTEGREQDQANGKSKENLQPIIINNMVPATKQSGQNSAKVSEDLQVRQRRIQRLEGRRESRQIQQHLTYSTPKCLVTEMNQASGGQPNKGQRRGGLANNQTNQIDIESPKLHKKAINIDKAEVTVLSCQTDPKQVSPITPPLSECLNANQTNSQVMNTNQYLKQSSQFQRKNLINVVHAQGVQIIQSQRQHTPYPQIQDCRRERSCDTMSIKEHQAPVLLEIPIDSSTPFAGMSLAQAFKKKVGKLPSQKSQTLVHGLLSQNSGAPQSYQSTTEFSCGVSKVPANYNSEPLSVSQITRKPAHRNRAKPRLTSKQNRGHQSYPGNKQSVATPKPKNQPSQQLINRLIYGTKAKVTKKQMYALTKKNYQNLPEVQEKKKVAKEIVRKSKNIQNQIVSEINKKQQEKYNLQSR